jgi:hypothetical protein
VNNNPELVGLALGAVHHAGNRYAPQTMHSLRNIHHTGREIYHSGRDIVNDVRHRYQPLTNYPLPKVVPPQQKEKIVEKSNPQKEHSNIKSVPLPLVKEVKTTTSVNENKKETISTKNNPLPKLVPPKNNVDKNTNVVPLTLKEAQQSSTTTNKNKEENSPQKKVTDVEKSTNPLPKVVPKEWQDPSHQAWLNEVKKYRGGHKDSHVMRKLSTTNKNKEENTVLKKVVSEKDKNVPQSSKNEVKKKKGEESNNNVMKKLPTPPTNTDKNEVGKASLPVVMPNSPQKKVPHVEKSTNPLPKVFPKEWQDPSHQAWLNEVKKYRGQRKDSHVMKKLSTPPTNTDKNKVTPPLNKYRVKKSLVPVLPTD